MEFNQITQLERELLFILKEEYSFYQSLYILIDKQKDMIKYDKDEKLLDLYTEIERCYKRINKSDAKINSLKTKNPKMFPIASSAPEVKKIVNSISTLIKKSISLIRENESYIKNRHDRLKAELQGLQNSQKIMRYIKDSSPPPHFVNNKN